MAVRFPSRDSRAPTQKDELIDDIFELGSIEHYAGTMACLQTLVQERLERIRFPRERIRIVPGFLEKTLQSEVVPGKVCFAYMTDFRG